MSGLHSLVFAGGGNRCLWQAGFWYALEKESIDPPEVVVGVSAGAAVACGILAGKNRDALEFIQNLTVGISRNFDFSNLRSGRRVFPHYEVYRRGLRNLLTEETFRALQQGPEFRVLLALPPRWSGPLFGTLLGFGCYTIEKHLTEPLHPRLPGLAGFRPLTVSLSECARPDDLVRLILASSCTPPVLPAMRWRGALVLDGGLVDNVPVKALRPGDDPALILLTRRYPAAKLRGHGGRTYIQPSRSITVSKWDYTDPQGLEDAFNLGMEDGKRFLAEGPGALQL